MRRTVLAKGIVGVAVLVGLAACTGSSSASAGTTSASASSIGSSSSSAPSGGTTSGTTGSSTATSATGGSPTKTSGSAAATVAECRSSGTSVAATTTEGSGAAGHYGVTITVTNTGSAVCRLYGFPGVSMVYGDKGKQLGAAADREGVKGVGVIVKPNGHATAQVLVTQAGNVCEPVDAKGLRIYLPGETHSQFAPINMQGCTDSATSLLRISAFGQG